MAILRVTALGHMPGGEQWANVFHVVGDVPDALAAAGIFDSFTDFYNDVAPFCHSTWGLDVVRLNEVGEGVLFEDVVTGLTGSGSGTALPSDCAVVITWQSAILTRRGRGRTYLCGFTGGQLAPLVTGGPTVVTSSTASSLATAATGLLDSLDPYNLSVYSRTAENAYGITHGSVSRRWATQRRRDLETPEDRVGFTA